MPESQAEHYHAGEAIICWLGRDVDYREAWELQKRILNSCADGRGPEKLLLLEHSAVYTAGRLSSDAHIVDVLPAPLLQTDRGGQVTYHGPGQLIGYPIVRLAAHGIGPKTYVRLVESSIIDALESVGVQARTEDGLTGVWTDAGKIAAIGVRVSRGVAMHGFALNVSVDLEAFKPIVPCGIADCAITSVNEITTNSHDVLRMASLVADSLAERLGWQCRWLVGD